MRKIVYYVAVSLDGYISGEGDDISGFVQQGPGVSQYMQDLLNFDTVIMGRKTYEFGYQFGLKPGQPAYPQMLHYIFSKSLKIDNLSDQVKICLPDIGIINQMKSQPGSDIYLCGGGQFAGWLLDHGLIDRLKIKLNPLILGKGTRLFGDSATPKAIQLLNTRSFEDGIQIIEYSLTG